MTKMKSSRHGADMGRRLGLRVRVLGRISTHDVHTLDSGCVMKKSKEEKATCLEENLELTNANLE
jgi:hypothetical protein